MSPSLRTSAQEGERRPAGIGIHRTGVASGEAE